MERIAGGGVKMPWDDILEDSITYQEILKKGEEIGRAKAAREFLVMVGTSRFGPPNSTILRKLRTIIDKREIHRLGLRLFKVRTWKELLAAK